LASTIEMGIVSPSMVSFMAIDIKAGVR